jgi:hypothetical protein
MSTSHFPRLRVSDNHRFLVWDDGRPFFWLGDTVWELFHRATPDEAELYLRNRRAKGFSVIQAVLLAEFDGLAVPNCEGQLPLVRQDPLQPNERYFEFVDRLIALAAHYGILVGLVPAWGDKVELLPHGKGPVILDPENARGYGAWLGRRYRNTWNIIWINGGDRSGGGANHAVWTALAEGIKSQDPNHLMTFHPWGGGGGHSSSEWFHEAPWLDFNLAQSGHERRDLPNHEIVSHDYHLRPAKPCLDGEPRYEDHAVNWKPAELGYFDDYDVRQAAYWALFAGAFGHTYGCHPVWQWLAPGREPIGFARRPWTEALDLPGAAQMGYARTLIESRPMLSRIPDQSLLADPKTGGEHLRAARGDGYAFIYLPVGGEVTVRRTALGGHRWRAHWFDPRTGLRRETRAPAGPGDLTFAAPSTGRGNDWILVLDEDPVSNPHPVGG